jgi:hypothetical protein
VLTPQVAAVRAIHISQLRDALGEVYEKAGLAPPVYTNQTIVPGVTVAKAAHLLEIRAAVAGLP